MIAAATLLLPLLLVAGDAPSTAVDTDQLEEAKHRRITVAEALAAARRTGVGWDVQFDFGMRVLPNQLRRNEKKIGKRGWPVKAFDWGEIDPSFPLTGRVSIGGLMLAEPWLVTLGVSTTLGGIGLWSIGVIGEITHIWSGLWGQFEPAWAFGHGMRLSVAAGYSILGVEYRVAPRDKDHAVFVKLRFPLGLIYFVKTHF